MHKIRIEIKYWYFLELNNICDGDYLCYIVDYYFHKSRLFLQFRRKNEQQRQLLK